MLHTIGIHEIIRQRFKQLHLSSLVTSTPEVESIVPEKAVKIARKAKKPTIFTAAKTQVCPSFTIVDPLAVDIDPV